MPRLQRRYDLLRKRLDVFVRMLPGVEAGDVRALHRARVASRRLRELIPVLQLEGETALKLGRRLRRVTAELGGVRELDVLAQLAEGLDARHPRRAIERVIGAIALERSAARGALVNGKTMNGLRRVAAKLRRVLESVDSRERQQVDRPAHGWEWTLGARVAHRASALRRAIDAAGTVYVAERLHDVRIALKKLRYALELAAEARLQKTTPELRALRRGQDLLGHLHDVQMLVARAHGVRDAPGTDAADAADIDRLVDVLETDCRHLHARYLRERAALVALCDRLTAASVRRTGVSATRIRRSA